MKKVAIGVLAAAGIAMAVPAHADGVWIGVGPFGVGIGTGPYYYDNGPYGYYDGDYAYARHCRTVTVDDGYGLRRVQRCW